MERAGQCCRAQQIRLADSDSEETVVHGNPRNNHDSKKHKHVCRADAKVEIRIIQRLGCEGRQSLTAYYKAELRGW